MKTLEFTCNNEQIQFYDLSKFHDKLYITFRREMCWPSKYISETILTLVKNDVENLIKDLTIKLAELQ